MVQLARMGIAWLGVFAYDVPLPLPVSRFEQPKRNLIGIAMLTRWTHTGGAGRLNRSLTHFEVEPRTGGARRAAAQSVVRPLWWHPSWHRVEVSMET